MGVALVHYFDPDVSTVQHISPSPDDTALAIQDGLVEVEPVEVECHGGDAHSSEPDPHYWPCTQEEVQGAAVVEGGILEDQTAKIPVGRYDVVGLFFLAELVTVVLGLGFSGFSYQGRSYQAAVHGAEQRTAKYPSYTQHVEGVHEDVVLSLEHQHEVECPRNPQWHPIREGPLSDGVDQEYGGSGRYGSRVGYTDPGAHPQTVGQLPLTAHVAEHANEEVEYDELIGPTVVQPLIQRSRFPDGIEVQPDSVGGGYYCTGDDVVAV